VLYRDIRKLREDYLRVMEDGRRNHPDTWNAAVQQVATGVHSFATKGKMGFAPAAVPGKPVQISRLRYGAACGHRSRKAGEPL
jgi:hypothetical protein